MRKLTDTLDPNTNVENTDKHSAKHESAERQVSGSALYVDDIPAPHNLKYAALGLATISCGHLKEMDLSKVKASLGVIDVITVSDVPGHTDIAPVFDGDPVLADKQIKFHGQPIFAVLADNEFNARKAAQLAIVNYSEESPALDTKQAHKKQSFVKPAHTMTNGDPEAIFSSTDNAENMIVSGEINSGAQEHLYLEGQVSLAIPEEQDRMFIHTSSQHPSEVQKLVAEVLNVPFNKVTVDMRRMGGGFGGKETQAAQWACIAALFANRNRVPVKLRLPRQHDMIVTGKRHPFSSEYKVAITKEGKIRASDITINGNCGHSADLSDAIVDRAMFHADNGYHLGTARVEGHRCQTNMVSHTAFRGFGGPQGMLIGEAIIENIARKTGLDPLTIRKRNLYDDQDCNTTHYGMVVENNLLPDIINVLERSADYWKRREEITEFNKHNSIIKKGLSLTPVKFGISFTAKHLNQAGALLHIYTDGSVQINHGGTEMGQGLHTKIAQIVANELGLSLDRIEVTSTRTDKVPNTSPTAASSGTDINGKAAQHACIQIKERLARFFAEQAGNHHENVTFSDGFVHCDSNKVPFTDLVQQAYMNRISLSAAGFYKTPKLQYNRDTGQGRPFFYFSYGAAVSEVTLDTLTGEYVVNRVDILHDVGNSINPAIDIGQIEGGFIQGMGWLTSEEVVWDDSGKLLSNNPATYKIPAIGDTPEVFNVNLFDRPNPENSIYHSKAVGEPPLMLAMSVWCAIKDAISSMSDYTVDPQLDPPATPEKVLSCISQLLEQTNHKEHGS